jgi:DNA-directed RNA polymerase subunit beta
MEADVTKIQYIDIVPRQVVGTSASLIPFLQHDDGTRALMGTHMQCQAVPLVRPEPPIVGTGMEALVAESMGWVVRARHEGTVVSSDAKHVTIKVDNKHLDDLKKAAAINSLEGIVVKDDTETYTLKTFVRSAQSTCYTQRPAVKAGDKVNIGDIIIDSPAAKHGELALGQNLLIAYASFEGLGYEDAIVVSDRLIKEDLLTSIHINEYEAQVMDTKLGPEELTRDIPNVSESDLKNLTEEGIVAIGSTVGPNDILVGKIAPKGETELTAEEKLLRAIFGEKAREVRDTSLRMPHGESGVVIDVQILEKDAGDELDPGVLKQIKVRVAQLRKITVGDKVAGRHGNKGVISKIVPAADMPHLPDGRPVDIIISFLSVLARMNLGQLMEAQLGWAAQKLGYTVALPVFERISEDRIYGEMEKAGLPITGKVKLIDGRTGMPFEEETAVGIGYILKLIHMVEDKTHARSTGPYSLVTQQPLGGKAQMGGQRLGEMEVWALEAHKAAYTLQEMLTIKSDDVVGRSRAFEAIVKGTDIPASTVPESFKVLVKELQSLGLSVIPTRPIVTAETYEEDVLDKPEVVVIPETDLEEGMHETTPDEDIQEEEPTEETLMAEDQESSLND